MNDNRASGHRTWPTAAFIVPLLVWLGITGFGLWREQTIGAADLAQRLDWLATSGSGAVQTGLNREKPQWAWAEVTIDEEGKVTGGAWFEQTPLPREENGEFIAFKEGRFEDIVNSSPGALSPSGVPLGPMAAFRQLMLAQDDGVARQRAKTLRELCFAFPSVISPELMERADEELKRRGLKESDTPPWRDRWRRIALTSQTLETLLRDPLPQPGVRVMELAGEFWRVEIRREQKAVRLGLIPLSDVIRCIAKDWSAMPLGNGMQLSLVSSNGDLLGSPRDSSDWPRSLVKLDGEDLNVLAVADPALAATAVRLRITILGGGCLLAAVMLSAAWWRQQNAVRMQQDLVRQKDDFLSTVSHELRTPAASIELLAGNLAAGTVNDPESMRIYHQKLLQESRRLVSTTEHLLDFSLMERGYKHYRFKALDTTLLADDVRQVLLPIAALKGIELAVSAEKIEPLPEGDFDSIRRAVVNLGDNAIKFAPESSRVGIRIESLPPVRWMIRVQDHGPGVSKSDQLKIFERFYRGGNVLDRETRGTGIGLAIVKRIMESHNGTVELTESSPAGSVFTCVLPLHPAQSRESDENSID